MTQPPPGKTYRPGQQTRELLASLQQRPPASAPTAAPPETDLFLPPDRSEDELRAEVAQLRAQVANLEAMVRGRDEKISTLEFELTEFRQPRMTPSAPLAIVQNAIAEAREYKPPVIVAPPVVPMLPPPPVVALRTPGGELGAGGGSAGGGGVGLRPPGSADPQLGSQQPQRLPMPGAGTGAQPMGGAAPRSANLSPSMTAPGAGGSGGGGNNASMSAAQIGPLPPVDLLPRLPLPIVQPLPETPVPPALPPPAAPAVVAPAVESVAAEQPDQNSSGGGITATPGIAAS